MRQRRILWLTPVFVAAALLAPLAASFVAGAPSAAAQEDSTNQQTAAACPEANDPIALSSVEQVEDLLVGVWVRCERTPGELGDLGAADPVGFELTEDGTSYTLYDSGDGLLVQAAGIGEQGDWEIVGTGSFQLNVTRLGGGVTHSPIERVDDAGVLRLVDDATGSASYVRWVGDAPVPGPSPNQPDDCPYADDPIEPTSIEEAGQLLTGVWVRCGEVSVFGAIPDGQLGIELATDGRFHRLYGDGDGGLLRASGLEQEGTWRLLGEELDQLQLDLDVVGSGTIGVGVTLFAEPQLWWFAGEDAGGYVPWTGPPPVDGTPSSAGFGTCGVPVDPIVPASIEEARQLAVGTWLSCGDANLLGSGDPASVGIDLTADGRYVEVLEEADGTLVRVGGAGPAGTWTVLDLTDEDGPGSYQINFSRDGGTTMAQASFFASPEFMRLHEGGTPYDYVRWSGEPPVVAPGAAGGEPTAATTPSTAATTPSTSVSTDVASAQVATLPRTGSPLVPVAVLALMLAVAGVAILVAVRRTESGS